MIRYALQWLVLWGLLSGVCRAQVGPAQLEGFLVNDIKKQKIYLRHPVYVKKFYESFQYNIAWVNNPASLLQLADFIRQSPDLGLNATDYRLDIIVSVLRGATTLATKRDTMLADVRLTDEAIHFFREAAFGNQAPDIGYNGLNYSPACLDIPSLLANSLATGSFHRFLDDIELKSPEYLAVKNKIIWYNKTLLDTSLKVIPRVTSLKANDQNKPLMQKLYQLGMVDTLVKKMPSADLKAKIKELQRQFSLLSDGVMRSTLLTELNVPLSVRVDELSRALNTLRWLRCIRLQWPHTIVVNIPSATLLVYSADGVAMESKIIVGKKSTRTPLLASTVTEVILYPYWTVPGKIASRELLPMIKRNTAYLDANNFQVLDGQGRIVNPFSVDWSKFSAGYFPYTLRQSTGCDNSLGLIKLNFYSPYGVYLHDTPWKALFSFGKRYFSHGCMRVEKAIELGRLILRENRIAIDTLTAKGCLYNQRPITVPATEKMPVFVLYNTAWVDSSATVRFSEDVYGKLLRRK